MKTVEELYKEIAGSLELQKELKAAYDDTLEAFLKKHGCDADVKEFTDYMRSQNEGEIDDESAAEVAGGFGGFGGYPTYKQEPPVEQHALL